MTVADQLRQEGYQEGYQEIRAEAERKFVQNMINSGFSVEEISKILDMPATKARQSSKPVSGPDA